ncbi:MAG: ABC transporter ATP-binding protein [Mesorhizobium sp.]
MTLLSVKDLTIRLGNRDVVNSISFDVAPGEFIGLVGPNGAGKSSLLRALAGILPYSGSISIDGQSSTGIPTAKCALKLAFLPQDRDIAWNIPVETLVALGRSPYLPAFSSLRPNDLEAVSAAMRRMDVDAFRDRPINQLSGGERARVLVARALAQETPLLLADEPMAGLDPAHNLSLMSTFASLAREGKSVIASSHDLGLAAACCTRVILLDKGRVIADGTPAEVLTPDRLRTIYGINAFITTAEGQMVVQPLSLAESHRVD